MTVSMGVVTLRTFIYLLENNYMLVISVGMKGLKTCQNVDIGMTETIHTAFFFNMM